MNETGNARKKVRAAKALMVVIAVGLAVPSGDANPYPYKGRAPAGVISSYFPSLLQALQEAYDRGGAARCSEEDLGKLASWREVVLQAKLKHEGRLDSLSRVVFRLVTWEDTPRFWIRTVFSQKERVGLAGGPWGPGYKGSFNWETQQVVIISEFEDAIRANDDAGARAAEKKYYNLLDAYQRYLDDHLGNYRSGMAPNAFYPHPPSNIGNPKKWGRAKLEYHKRYVEIESADFAHFPGLPKVRTYVHRSLLLYEVRRISSRNHYLHAKDICESIRSLGPDYLGLN